MRAPAHTSTAIVTALSALAVQLLSAAGVVAGEYCVECSEPAATYRCVFAEDELVAGKLPGRAMQVVCMTELAKAGGHGFCRVTAGKFGMCNGVERVVGVAPRDDGGEKAAPAPAASQPPATLADLAKQTAQSSGDQLKDAGSAIKSGAKKIGSTVGDAFDCVFSLFQRC